MAILSFHESYCCMQAALTSLTSPEPASCPARPMRMVSATPLRPLNDPSCRPNCVSTLQRQQLYSNLGQKLRLAPPRTLGDRWRWGQGSLLQAAGFDRGVHSVSAMRSQEELVAALTAAAEAGPEFLQSPTEVCALANELSEIRTASACAGAVT